MSSICIFVFEKTDSDSELFIKNNINNVVNKYQRGAFWDLNYEEPFLSKYIDSLVVSISDSVTFDNCEKLLLADDSCYNGESATQPFSERIKVIQECANFLISHAKIVHLYIGLSGTEYEDYDEESCCINDLTCAIEKCYSKENYYSRCTRFVIT